MAREIIPANHSPLKAKQQPGKNFSGNNAGAKGVQDYEITGETTLPTMQIMDGV